jgi:protein phosphatase
MGSRAVVAVCRDEAAARRRFGVQNSAIGLCVTRTGRRFFDDTALEAQFLDTVAQALGRSGLWEALDTDWALLDCELMPWSAKAQDLLRQQYAAVGAAATAALPEAVAVLRRASERVEGLQTLVEKFASRETNAGQFAAAYRRYCWSVDHLSGLKLAPFHLLAAEGAVHTDKDHRWHLEMLGRLCAGDDTGLLFTTRHQEITLADCKSVSDGVRWWEVLTDAGGEGMVVKPLDFITKGNKSIVQPAIKCRGREYLRIIYGPDYTAPEHLERLRSRGLGAKRSLALREFALGIEGLERFVRREPLRRVHECVFGVLALESEPVDPRL